MNQMVLVFENRKADVVITDKIMWTGDPRMNCLALSCARERAEWDMGENMKLVMVAPL